MSQAFWPADALRAEVLDAFIQVLGMLGYQERTDASLEAGKQKVALFANQLGKPTHAARQVEDGWWASKLGENIDIEHAIDALDGPAYGSVVVILGRMSPP